MSAGQNMMSQKEERQRIEGIYWAGVLIWAGLVFGADSIGWLPRIGGAGPWSWVFLGAGVYSLVGSLYRLSSTEHSSPPTSDYVWGVIFLLIGLGGFTAVNITWPLVLIVVGVVLLIRIVVRRE